MKKYITSIISFTLLWMIAFTVFGQQEKTASVYLGRFETTNSISIDSGQVWEFPAYNDCYYSDWKNHLRLNVSYCCFSVGDTDLIIMNDPANGVRKVECGYYKDAWFIPNYVTVKIQDMCSGKTIITQGKNVFALQDRTSFPYCHGYYPLVNCVYPYAEEDSLEYYSSKDPNRCNPIVSGIQKYNWPDTTLYNSKYRQDLNTDSCTYLSRGNGDCYTGNNFIIDGLKDGYYNLILSVNIPARSTKLSDTYPRTITIPIRKYNSTSVEIYPTVVFVKPVPPINVIANSRSISWQQVQDANSYAVQRYIANGKNQGQEQGAEQYTQYNYFIDNLATKGQYYWKVRSINCAGSSLYSNPSNRENIK